MSKKKSRRIAPRPLSAPVPQDHKPKAGEQRAVTVLGLTLTVDPKAFDDLEVMDSFAQLRGGDPLVLPGLLRSVVGTDQYPRVLDHLRDADTGRVSAEAGAQFFVDLMEEIAPSS